MTLVEISRCFLVDRPGGPVNPVCVTFCLKPSLTLTFSNVLAWYGVIVFQFMVFSCTHMKIRPIHALLMPSVWQLIWLIWHIPYIPLMPYMICRSLLQLKIDDPNSRRCDHTPGSVPQDPRCRWDLEIPRHRKNWSWKNIDALIGKENLTTSYDILWFPNVEPLLNPAFALDFVCPFVRFWMRDPWASGKAPHICLR